MLGDKHGNENENVSKTLPGPQNVAVDEKRATIESLTSQFHSDIESGDDESVNDLTTFENMRMQQTRTRANDNLMHSRKRPNNTYGRNSHIVNFRTSHIQKHSKPKPERRKSVMQRFSRLLGTTRQSKSNDNESQKEIHTKLTENDDEEESNTLTRSNSSIKRKMEGRNLRNEAEADRTMKKLRRNSRIIIQIHKDNAAILPMYLIHPESHWRQLWDAFMLALVLYYAVITPINISYDNSPFNVLVLELVFNTFFILDIVLGFFTTFKHDRGPLAGRYEVSHRSVILKYAKTWLLIDLLASIPVELIFEAATSSSADEADGLTLHRLVRLLRGIKLFRILRVKRIWKRLFYRARLNPSVVRLCKLFGFLIFEWHWIGCSYWFIASAEGFGGEWSPPSEVLAYSFNQQYIRAYFWAVTVTTGVGRDIIPETDSQFIFTTCAIIVGVLMYALIVGSVGSALQSIDSPDSQRIRRMDSVREYLRQRRVSDELTETIMSYYDYCYTRHITEHDEKILKDIHSALKEELDLEIFQQLLQKVPRFTLLPDALLLVLIHSLLTRIYLPNEIVYLIGERANEMFFVARGDLEELDAFGESGRYLSDGAFFGDQLFQSNARREATVRCVTHCELLILTKESLKKIMKMFPEFALIVSKWSNSNQYYSFDNKWKRIAYVVKNTRILKCLGADVTFVQMFQHLSRSDEEELFREKKSKKIKNKNTRKMSTKQKFMKLMTLTAKPNSIFKNKNNRKKTKMNEIDIDDDFETSDSETMNHDNDIISNRKLFKSRTNSKTSIEPAYASGLRQVSINEFQNTYVKSFAKIAQQNQNQTNKTAFVTANDLLQLNQNSPSSKSQNDQ